MINNDDYYTEDVEEKTNKNDELRNNFFKKSMKTIILIVVLIILVIILLLFNSCTKNNDSNNNDVIISLAYEELTVKVGETVKIEYGIINGDNSLEINWLSEDTSVATIDEAGYVTGIKVGISLITASYESINGVKEQYCVISVVDEKNNESLNDTSKPIIDINFISGNKDVWNNKDVEMEVLATDDSNDVILKYALNCNNDCQYKDVINNKIKVTEEGNNVVTVVATDASNNTTKVEVPVKIDKTHPLVSLGEKIVSVVYDNTGTKEICATCQDKVSGCKEEKVCKKITETENNVIIDVYDNAGNKASTQSFNVVVDKEKPTCTLEVNSSGNLTASYSDKGGSELEYYGFSSNYTGDNATSMKVGAGTHIYYVKDKSGNTNMCELIVKSRSNCSCPSGYVANDNISNSKCYRDDRRAGWSEISTEIVSSSECKSTCGQATTASTCVTCEKISGTTNSHKITKKATCSSGRVLYNGNCYYETNKNCSTTYYS